jgi:hypothetical protein
MSTEKNHARALRYRKLALSELDKEKAGLLNRIADEAEQGVLCTVDNAGRSPAPIKIFSVMDSSAMSSFPWPLTDDQLLLNEALEDVLASSRQSEPREKDEQEWLYVSAIDLILNAYEQGVRDRETLVNNALTIMGFIPRTR